MTHASTAVQDVQTSSAWGLCSLTCDAGMLLRGKHGFVCFSRVLVVCIVSGSLTHFELSKLIMPLILKLPPVDKRARPQ